MHPSSPTKLKSHCSVKVDYRQSNELVFMLPSRTIGFASIKKLGDKKCKRASKCSHELQILTTTNIVLQL